MDIQKRSSGTKTNSAVAPMQRSSVAYAGVAKQDSVSEVTSSPEPTPSKGRGKRGWKMWVIGALIVALAGGGVYAWQQHTLGAKVSELESELDTAARAKKNALEAQKTAEDALAKAQQGTTDASTAAAAAAEYVEIKELGFKFKPGEDLKDLVYFVSGNSAYFSTRSLMAASFKDGKATCAPDAMPFGVVTKYKAGESVVVSAGSQAKKIETVTDAKKVGSFYLYRSGPQAACSEVKAAMDLTTKQLGALKTALGSAEEIN